jgi:hypothetical protein
MSGNVTFQELIDDAKDRADMVGSTFVSDTTWKRYINKSKDVLYDYLIGAFGEDYYTIDYDFNLVGGTDSYALPADFYKLVSVELDLGGNEYLPLKRFSLRNRGRGYYNRYYNTYKYRLLGDKIYFTPNPSTGSAVKLWYIPLATNLVELSDTLKGFSGWDEFITIDAAIKALRKEESDTQELMMDRAIFTDKLETMRMNRDAANPKRVKDTSSRYFHDDEYYEGP